MELLNIKGLPRLATASNGIAFFDALDVCRAFKLDVSNKQIVLDGWKEALQQLSFDPDREELEVSFWVPLVMIVAFVESLGLKRAQFEQGQEWPPASLEYGLMKTVLEDQFAMAKRTLGQAN